MQVKDRLLKRWKLSWSTNQIPLVNLIGKNKSLQPDQISKEITDGLPQELYDCILYFLQDDLKALQACSVVCRGWKHLCDRWLFTQPLRAYSLTSQTGFKFKEPLRGVALHEASNTILYGTAKGIYYRDMSDPTDAPYMAHRMSDIRQIDIVDRPMDRGGPFVIWRAALRLEMVPLNYFDRRTRTLKKPKPVKWEGNCDFYVVGVLADLDFIAAVHGKERTLVRIEGDKFVRGYGAAFHNNPLAVSFVRNTVVTVLLYGFQTMNYPNRFVGSIDPPGNMPEGITTARPLYVAHGVRIRDSKSYTLVCFKEFAMFTTELWAFVGQAIVWTHPAQNIFFQDEYIFIISANHIEIRHMFNKDVKRIHAGKFRFLSGQHAESSRAVVIRENGYIFGFRAGKDASEEMVNDADV